MTNSLSPINLLDLVVIGVLSSFRQKNETSRLASFEASRRRCSSKKTAPDSFLLHGFQWLDQKAPLVCGNYENATVSIHSCCNECVAHRPCCDLTCMEGYIIHYCTWGTIPYYYYHYYLLFIGTFTRGCRIIIRSHPFAFCNELRRENIYSTEFFYLIDYITLKLISKKIISSFRISWLITLKIIISWLIKKRVIQA